MANGNYKLILCFDGTSNEPEDATEEKRFFGFGSEKDHNITNVFKLHLMFGGDLKGNPVLNGQRSYYYSGVGTYGGALRRVFNQALAPENKDVGQIIRSAVDDLVSWEKNNPDTKYDLFIFGFSRGAAIARRFASVVRKFDALREPPTIRFLGVFETVASIGKPNLDDDTRPISDVMFENGTLSPYVKEALHILSLDERRIAFMPTLMNHEDKVTEVWFAGAHSDIGGGFNVDGLSDVTLEFMTEELVRRGLGIQLLDPIKVNCEEIKKQCENCDLDLDDLIIQPNPLGKLHDKQRPPITSKVTLTNRIAQVYENDKPSNSLLPLIHHSAIQRVHNDTEYRPKALRGPHMVLNSFGADHMTMAEKWASLSEHLLVGPRSARPLSPGSSQTFYVYANQKYNRSQVLLEEGGNYFFTIEPGQVWFDASIACSEKGWNRDTEDLGLKEIFIKISEGNRRMPRAEWFELIGAIGKNDDYLFQPTHHLSETKLFSPRAAGELFLFANDLASRYGNNRGRLKVILTRHN